MEDTGGPCPDRSGKVYRIVGVLLTRECPHYQQTITSHDTAAVIRREGAGGPGTKHTWTTTTHIVATSAFEANLIIKT